MRRLSFIIFLLINLHLLAQSRIDFGGEVKLRIGSNGIFAIGQSDLSPKSEYQNSSLHFLNQLGIWISAKDENNDLHTSIQMLNTLGQYDFSYGPLDTIVSQPDTSGWNKVWLMKAEWVDDHKANYQNSGYQVSDELSNWPGDHEGSNFVRYLAPFADVNSNERYDPENGDYPFIKGDEAVYVICNDNSFEHKVSGGSPLGLEVHILIYSYDDLPNTLFFEYYLINRLDFDYHDVQVGVFMSGACGNPNDNYAATVKSHNTIAIYNGNTVDEGGFGSELPFVYARFLNKELAGSIVFDNDTGFIGVPSNADEFDHFLHSRWKSGDDIQFGGNGISSSYSYPFMFVHDSDPDTEHWSEESAGTDPGYRMIMGNVHYDELKMGGFVKLNYSLGFGFFDSTESVISILNKSSTLGRDRYYSLSSNEWIKAVDVKLYPNPCKDYFIIEGLDMGLYKIKITDIQGLSLMSEEIQLTGAYRCNITLLPGVYQVELIRNGRMFNKILIVQP